MLDLTSFKSIPEYPEYLISKYGEIYSLKSNRLLKSRPNSRGYLQFSVTYNNKTKFILVSRAVARVWKDLPSLDSELQVDHDDRNILNNYYTNLVVLTEIAHRAKTREDNNWNYTSNICDCGSKKSYKSNKCKNCLTITNPEITKDNIEYWVSNYSWVRASKELGLSDNGLRKRYKKLGGDPKLIKKLPS